MEKKELIVKAVFTVFISLLSSTSEPDPLKKLLTMLLFAVFSWNAASFVIDLVKAKKPQSRWLRFKQIFSKYTDVRYDFNWIILSVVTTVLLTLLIWCYFKYQPQLLTLPITVLMFLLSVIIAPFFEEYMFRKLFLGEILLERSMQFAPPLNNRYLAPVWTAGMLLFQALIFAYLHEDITSWFAFWSRFALGLLAGILYLASKKNLLPGISAHATYNLMISIANFTRILA